MPDNRRVKFMSNIVKKYAKPHDKILDLGCGFNKIQISNCEVIGLDMRKIEKVDVVHNLEKMPLPFQDNSFDIIFSYGVLEHIRNLIPLMKDIQRILKKNGKFIILVPHFSTVTAFCDIDHIRFFSAQSFESFDPNSEFNYYNINFKVKTKILFKRFLKPFEIIFNYGFLKKLYEGTFLRELIPCFLLFVEMEAVK